ncbi:MAG: Serine/threonine-protein kinase PRP4 [Chrysothrix sp. TS-e1954]|nr:MAG: Serine/threonine-protein kinase PRP4 [Chrysothrix sp. TS-e1954]
MDSSALTKAHDHDKQRPASKISVNKKLRDALSLSRSPSPSISPQSPREPGRNGNHERPGPRRLSDESSGGKARVQAESRYAHYDNRPGYGGGSKKRQHYRDGGFQNSSSRGRPYEDRNRDSHRHKRRRSRSRSPLRSDIHHSSDSRHRRGSNDSGAALNGDGRSKGHEKRQSLSNGVRHTAFHFGERSTESRSKQARKRSNLAESKQDELVGCPKSVLKKTDPKSPSTHGKAEKHKVSFAMGVKEEEPPEELALAPEPEVMSIEERRRRREAIKNKHKSAATPLMVQVLEHSTVSQDATLVAGSGLSGNVHSSHGFPHADEHRVAPPNISAPSTPLSHASLGSPETPGDTIDDDLMGLSKQVDTDDTTHVEGPSAADYDPTNDMNEDRLRHQMHQEETNAEEHDETQANDRDVAITAPGAKQKPTKAAVADDMFASDEDDDDMFAAGAKKVTDDRIETEPSLLSKQPKQLDQSMLDNWDDDEGYYRIILGELLDFRYHVQSNLGKGVFSGVVRAHDNQSGELVAIKVIRNNETMTKAGGIEIGVLEKLNESDPDDKKHMIRLERHFTHKNHLCMVFENLNFNLREVLKKFGREVGLNSQAIRAYAQQMFLGLSLMRKCGILHADLKPDNMLVSGANNKHLKICDLGSAEDATDMHPKTDNTYLVSRFYRAPEIILGIPYDYAIDMWSVGCTLYEIWTGKILFNGRDNNQMLRCIMECRGKFSLKMLKKAEHAIEHFENDNDLSFCSREIDRITKKVVTRKMNFNKPTQDLKSRLFAAAPKNMSVKETKELNLFVDLLDRCLALNPERRITPVEALKHPFFKPAVPGPAGAK